MDKYLSIITNFGCHYECPYCIVKNTNIKVPKTTYEGLNKLITEVERNKCNIISVSGGGDPLYKFPENICWWARLFAIANAYEIPVEVHTTYFDAMYTAMIAEECYRMVYHLRSIEDLEKIERFSNEIVRVVYVVTDDMTEEDIRTIAEFVKNSDIIDELSFRQRVKPDLSSSYHLHDFLKEGHQKEWWYIEQCDYNIYYAENKVYERYSDFREE